MVVRGTPSIDPARLLDEVAHLEPVQRLKDRNHLLDRLGEAIARGDLPDVPDRDWGLELLAERAVDEARFNRLDTAERWAREVLDRARPEHRRAIARATEALGRSRAWEGTPAARDEAERLLIEAGERYRELGATDWLGAVTYWRGNAIYLQNGDLDRAVELMSGALIHLSPDSGWQTLILTFLADALTTQGRWDGAEVALAEAAEFSRRHGGEVGRAYIAWSRARLASVQGNAMGTERIVREIRRDAGEWFTTTSGTCFLADAAEMLDRVGLHDQADALLAEATARDADDEFVLQARAMLLARRGDPVEAITALQELARGDWLEKRERWRHTLFLAWATFRLGQEDAGRLTALALEQASAMGSAEIPLHNESEISTALLPLAEDVGSGHARALLLGDRELVVRVFGQPRVTWADGTAASLPSGSPGLLVRLLAVHPLGLPVDEVIDVLFPDADLVAGRGRLRQVLTRLRAAAGDLVVRDQDRLCLRPAWVDAVAFEQAADRARASWGGQTAQRAYAALALRDGPLLPGDPYADWAAEVRHRVDLRYLSLLELVGRDAVARGSHEEALTTMSLARDVDPDNPARYRDLADQLLSLGRNATARYLADLARSVRDREGQRMESRVLPRSPRM